jgi:hypothetical protein
MSDAAFEAQQESNTNIFIVAPCILSQFTKKNQQMN